MNSFLSKILSRNRNIILCLALAGLAGYAVVLPTQFKTMDDLVSIVNNPRIKHISRIGEIFTTSFFMEGSYYRPLVLVSFMAEFHLFALKSFFYNLTNLFLHIGNALFVFWIVTSLMKDKRTGFFSAFIFVIHPVHWEAVSNIPGRSILLCSFFFLSSFYSFLKFETQDKKNPFYYISVVCFILALLSKESAVMLPFVLAGYLFFMRDKDKGRSYGLLWPYMALMVFYFIIRRLLGITRVTAWDTPLEVWLGVGTFLKTCLYFTRQILLPVDFYYDHTTLLFVRPGDPVLMLSLCVWAGVFTAIFLNRRKIPAALLFFISWIVLNFGTVAQIIPIRAPGGRISTSDHFLYLPVIGAIVLLVTVTQNILSRPGSLKPSIKQILVGGYILFLFLTLLQQNVYATNQIAMFKRSLEHNPGNHRVRNSLAVCYGYAGKFEEAEYHYRQTLNYEPYNTKALIGLGKALADQGKYEEALAQYRNVKEVGILEGSYKGNLEYVYSRLIEQYEESGQTEKAKEIAGQLEMIKATKD
ncbi:MAG: tetratricopeptide repeat protein [Candidatus Omnitrophota bacterium]